MFATLTVLASCCRFPMSGFCTFDAWDEKNQDFISLTTEKISIQQLTELVADPSAGAISSFVGITRNNFEGKEVVSLSYEAYEDMARDEMANLCSKVSDAYSDRRRDRRFSSL